MERGSNRAGGVGGVGGSEEPRSGVLEEPPDLLLSNINSGSLGTDAAALGRVQTVEAAGFQRSEDARCAAGGASKRLMEEEVTEPDPQTQEPPGMPLPPGTHSEVNGDLPGNPYLRDGTVDVMESPAREPVVLQYPTEYDHSHQCG